jgi:membrane-associated phospholipid phosphatase
VPLPALDLALFRLFRTIGHTPAVERAVRAYSRAGEHALGWLALGAAGAVLDPARRQAWNRGAAVVAGSYVANQGLKLVVRRPRPAVPGLPPLSPTVTQLSLPSAHATTSVAAARAYGGLLPRGPLRIAALAMALSRLYLGVHWPSDVAVGAALGAVLGGRAR